jgi:hypothetical protein
VKAVRLLVPQGALAGRALVGTGASLVAIALLVSWYEPVLMIIENWAVPFRGVQIAFLGPLLAGEVALMVVALAIVRRPFLALGASLAVLATVGVFFLLQDSLYDATWMLWKGGSRCYQCFTRLGPGAFVALAGGGLGLLGGIILWRRKSLTTTAAGPPPSAPG